MTDTIATDATVAAAREPHTRSLSRDLAELLWETSDLPQPSSVTVYGSHDHMTLHFESDPASYATVAQWAARFGGTVVHRPITHEGQPSVICRTEWTMHGVKIDAFALIRTSG